MDNFVDAVPNWQSQAPPPPRHGSWRKWLLIGGIALAFLLTLGLGAVLGSQIGTTQAASVAPASTTNQSAGGSPGGPISFQAGSQTLPNAPSPGGQGQCVSLTVTAISGSTITAKPASGSAVTIDTTASTQYTENGRSVSASAVTVGSRISVMGTHNSDGSITATSINIG